MKNTSKDIYILTNMLAATEYKVELLDDHLTKHKVGETVYAIQKWGHGFTFTFDATTCIVTHISVHGRIFQRFHVQNIVAKLYEFFDVIRDVWEEKEEENVSR